MAEIFRIKNRIVGFDIPKVCVPLVGRSREDILAGADRIVETSASQIIDIVEFRADYYEDLGDLYKLNQIMHELCGKFTDIIFLFTIRSEKEGGEPLSFTEPDINTINNYIIENKLSDMVDVELFSGSDRISQLVETAKEKGVKIIMSNHDFNTTPSADTIISRLRMMQDMHADVAKIAVMPENELHVLQLLAATTVMHQKYAKIPIVTVSMGKLGTISRLTGQLYGSAITFAALDSSSAPGQLPVSDVNTVMKILSKTCEYE